MKKTLFIAAFILNINAYSQYLKTAPWNTASSKKSQETEKFKESLDKFESYWKTRNPFEKGSGYKPFKRWENHWKNALNDDGTIITPKQTWEAWRDRKKSNKSSLALPQSNWKSVGPFTYLSTGSWSPGQGRVNTVCVDPSNSNTIYIGAPAGGIWKSTDNGSKWTPLSDNIPQIGVSGIAVDYSNPDIIYISTGDRDGADTYSTGVLKSIDGGLTWNTTGLVLTERFSFSGDIIIHPTNSQVLWCATSEGLQKTTDGGATWTIVQTGDFSPGNIRLKPNNPDTVYAVSDSTVHVSTDSGNTFNTVTIPNTKTIGRLCLDTTANDENYVYILAVDDTTAAGFEGIFRSTDSGMNWTKTSIIPAPTSPPTPYIIESRQSFYDLALSVSQTDKNIVYTGCLNVWKSTDGGVNFKRGATWDNASSPAYTHADIHYLKGYGNKMYCASDGGIYVSDNEGNSFTDLTEGLQIGQFYKVATSKLSSTKLMGGLQDNGGYAYSNEIWKNYYGADGMDTAIDPLNENRYYGFIQFGGGLHVSNDAGDSSSFSVSAPVAETGTGDQGGNWITPLTMNRAGELFSGYSKLYRLENKNWIQQSSDTSSFGTGNFEQVVVDPNDYNIMYVVNNTRIYKSTNKGVDFTNPYTADANITSLCVNSSNSNIIYITTANTTGKALKSIDGGITFIDFSTGLPDIPKRVIKHQGRNTLNPLYLGTTLGVYYRDDSMNSWETFNTNLPNVEVTDLEINLEDNIITAATYGRGIWQSPIPKEISNNDINLIKIQSLSNNVSCDGNISPIIEVKNNGFNPISDITFNYDYNGTPISYNWNGSIPSSTSQNINLPNFTASKGAYKLNVEATIPNDAYSDNNISLKPFYANGIETTGQLNTFENSSDNLLSYDDESTTSLWKRGINSNGILSNPNNNVYTTNFTEKYPNNIKSFLYSPCYNFSGLSNPQIKFKMGFDLEPNYDIVYVEYSTNMGQTWDILGTQGPNWYNSDRTNASSGAANDCNNCPGAQWTGTAATLTEYSYPLNNLVGQSSVMFRIVFHSDELENQLGVIIDDFIIEGTLGNESFELKNTYIYPNPTAGIVNIASANKVIDNIVVFDISGKTIMTNTPISNSNNETIIDMRDIANGLYFMKISSGNQQTVKRIIKN